MAKLLAYNATMVERVDLTDALAVFRIRPDRLPEKRPWFTAGQYCVLGLNNVEQPELGSVQRPMSIASPPEIDDPIEFYIRRIDRPQSANPLTHLLWRLEKDDRMYMRAAAAGVFTIKDTVGSDDPRIRVMVAAGTGIAPFISMVRSEVARNPNGDLSKWILLHGASRPADLSYRHELRRLSASNHLQYWGTVSRRSEASDWTGDVGRVESFFDPIRLSDLEERLGLPAAGFTPSHVVVFVCGLTGTITNTIVSLIDRGFVPGSEPIRRALGVPPSSKSSLFFEDYSAEPVLNIGDPAVIEPLRSRMQDALAKA
jgi:ferredoxin--NADP+ reductase